MEEIADVTASITEALHIVERVVAGRSLVGFLRSPKALLQVACALLFTALLRFLLVMLDRMADSLVRATAPAEAGAFASDGTGDAPPCGDGGVARAAARSPRFSRAGRIDADLAVAPGEEPAPRAGACCRASYRVFGDGPGVRTVLAAGQSAAAGATWVPLVAGRSPPGVEKTRMAGWRSHVLFVAIS